MQPKRKMYKKEHIPLDTVVLVPCTTNIFQTTVVVTMNINKIVP